MRRISTGLPALSLALALVLGSAACQRQAEPAQAASPVTALINARVIDGTGGPPLERATILIREGTIEAVGAAVDVPEGATTIDLAGKTIMPGIVNGHGHVQGGMNPTLSIRDDLIKQLEVYGSYGVTTVMSMGANLDDEPEQLRLRDEQGAPGLNRARVYTTGRSVRRMKTPEDARRDVDRVADLGVDMIKLHFDDPPNNMSVETWGAIVEQAQARGIRTAPHLWYLRDAKAAVEKGVGALAHSVRDQDVDQELIDAMRTRGVGVIPTLTREVALFAYETTPEFLSEPFFQRGISLYQGHVDMVTDPAYQEKVRASPTTQMVKKSLVQAQRNLKLMSDGGVLIGFGTDTGLPNPANIGRWQGYFEHRELELMVEAGLTPLQALTAATGGSARVVQLDRVGTLEPGKAADLVVLNANPLDDIRNTRQIDAVWIAGHPIGASTD